MDIFIGTFSAVLGIGFGFLALFIALSVGPDMILGLVRRLTTRKWQVSRYNRMIARGQLESARWAAQRGWATEE